MRIILIFIFIFISLLSCSKRKPIETLTSIQQVQGKQIEEGVKAEFKDLPPLVSQMDIPELCRANTACKYSKITRNWEIKDYDMYELPYPINSGHSFFFLKKGYSYDFQKKQVVQKKLIVTELKIDAAKNGSIKKSEENSKIIGSFDYMKPDSFKPVWEKSS